MKAISVTALHYGLSYLEYAVRSVIDAVDECWFLYSPTGSHGHSSDVQCPEHAAELYEVARKAAGDKFRWYMGSPGQWRHEGEQREFIFQLAPDADVYLTLDADEVWPDGFAQLAIEDIQRRGVKEYKLPLIHFWRSFHRAVVDDGAAPTRLFMPKGEDVHIEALKLLHFGYAQSTAIVEYKQHVHGHKGEWRQDWFDTKWLPNAQVDVHPTNMNYWNPVEIDDANVLLAEMRDHPYFDLGVIP